MPRPRPRALAPTALPPTAPRAVRALGLGLLLAALLAGCGGTSTPTETAATDRTVEVTLCFGAASGAADGGRCSDASLSVELPTD